MSEFEDHMQVYDIYKDIEGEGLSDKERYIFDIIYGAHMVAWAVKSLTAREEVIQTCGGIPGDEEHYTVAFLNEFDFKGSNELGYALSKEMYGRFVSCDNL